MTGHITIRNNTTQISIQCANVKKTALVQNTKVTYYNMKATCI
jgi:hypothetical protein